MATEALAKAAVGVRVSLSRQELEVQKSCGQNGRGQWVCITHKKVFDNGFQKDSHITHGSHVMAWFCDLCGQLEVP